MYLQRVFNPQTKENFWAGMFALISLALIWFGDALGGYTGTTGFARPHITKESPGCLVKLMGWFFLLWVVIVVIGDYIQTVPK